MYFRPLVLALVDAAFALLVLAAHCAEEQVRGDILINPIKHRPADLLELRKGEKRDDTPASLLFPRSPRSTEPKERRRRRKQPKRPTRLEGEVSNNEPTEGKKASQFQLADRPCKR